MAQLQWYDSLARPRGALSSVEVEASSTNVLVADTCRVALPLLPFTTAVIAPEATKTDVVVVATANTFDPAKDCTFKAMV